MWSFFRITENPKQKFSYLKKYINNLYTGKEVEIKTDEDFEGSAKRVAKLKASQKQV